MRSLLTVEVALGLLLVTSFTCVGLVALWAATSPRHWFLRVAGLVALLSPLLLIPAFEPLLIFAVQAVGVQIGVGAYRWRQRLNWQPTEGASGLNPPTSRQYTSFSLASAMLAVVLIAIGVAVIVRVPRDVWEDFPIQLLTGFILAVATLIAAWLACGRTTTRRRIVIAESVTLIASLALACLNDWSKMFSDTMAGAIANWPNVATPLFPFLTTIWLIVIPITGLAVVGLLKLYGQIHAADEASSQLGKPRQERLTKVSLLAILLIALALPPGLTVWKLAHPLPLPIVDLPSPNGYDDLVAVGKMFTSPILNTGVRPKSTSELREEVAKYAAAYDLARLGLSHKIVVPLIVPLGEAYPRLIDVDGSIRNVARALMMESELARREERYGDSASIAMENIRLGQAIASGGTLRNSNKTFPIGSNRS